MVQSLNPSRIPSLDILRGMVMVLMALDHLRDMYSLYPFSPEDLTQTTPLLFFTRWVTHFCAPTFVLLAGTSIFLYQQKLKDQKALSRFLLIRGLWLMVAEVLIVNPFWMFSFFWQSWGFFLQVIWVIGLGMVLMAVLIRFPAWVSLGLGLLIVCGHNLLDGVQAAEWGSWSWLFTTLHVQGWIPLNAQGSFGIAIVYPVLPWVGVLMVGYAFGQVMLWPPAHHLRFLWVLGSFAVLCFLLLRGLNSYGNALPWSPQEDPLYTLMSFLNVQKYPPSLSFLLMTLGPALLLLAAFERGAGKVGNLLRIFGRVPFFFYLIHLLIPHAFSLVYFRITLGEWMDLFGGGGSWPEAYTPSLLRLYILWPAFMILLYFPTRWYYHYKSTHRHWWLKYL
ncbi:MAG: heparan-alpha-glucosaminide N-acetyltransferase domain-containing protein [Bacteroidota bacterium]